MSTLATKMKALAAAEGVSGVLVSRSPEPDLSFSEPFLWTPDPTLNKAKSRTLEAGAKALTSAFFALFPDEIEPEIIDGARYASANFTGTGTTLKVSGNSETMIVIAFSSGGSRSKSVSRDALSLWKAAKS